MTEADTLLNLQPMLTRLTWKFAYLYGLRTDELLGEAQIVAIQAVRSYQIGPLALQSWVYRNVLWHFRAKSRYCSWRARFGERHLPLPPDVPEKSRFTAIRDQWSCGHDRQDRFGPEAGARGANYTPEERTGLDEGSHFASFR